MTVAMMINVTMTYSYLLCEGVWLAHDGLAACKAAAKQLHLQT